jgi:hypothetical protein
MMHAQDTLIALLFPSQKNLGFAMLGQRSKGLSFLG